ncbi:hypothetical protein V6N13_111527 [Hibiscus sabdariffa]|uniref:Uncharacterized protein n=1 Tax=Hibiscus sabdariffa TaxID=183260 RepID=A0ABR2TKK5_9ROSI
MLNGSLKGLSKIPHQGNVEGTLLESKSGIHQEVHKEENGIHQKIGRKHFNYVGRKEASPSWPGIPHQFQFLHLLSHFQLLQIACDVLFSHEEP